MYNERLEDGVEASLDGRPQVGKAVNMPDIGLGTGGALFFHVRKL